MRDNVTCPILFAYTILKQYEFIGCVGPEDLHAIHVSSCLLLFLDFLVNAHPCHEDMDMANARMEVNKLMDKERSGKGRPSDMFGQSG